MRKGNAFSDIHMINAGYRTLSSDTVYPLDTVDLEFGGSKFFNSFRVNMTMAALVNITHPNFYISMRLYHGDTTTSLGPVTEKDIIGPVDEYNQPIIGPDGEWKKLITYEGIDVKTMGYRVYSAGYIGTKRYVKLYVHTPGPPGVSGKYIWGLIISIHTHVGKCYDRYKLQGTTGGQIRYPY